MQFLASSSPAIEEYTTKKDVVLSNFPTLYTCMTDRYGIGVMWIAEFLPIIIKHIRPDVIIIDNARKDGPKNYTLFRNGVRNIDRAREIEGYKVIYHNSQEQFVLLRRK